MDILLFLQCYIQEGHQIKNLPLWFLLQTVTTFAFNGLFTVYILVTKTLPLSYNLLSENKHETDQILWIIVKLV